MRSKPIAEIVIPKYITQVQTAKSRRAKYYKKGNKNIPKKYDKYKFNKKGYLVDDNGKRIIANPRSAGTPRFETLSGNRFSSGYGSYQVRNNLVGAIKDFFRPFVQEQLEPFDPKDFPLRVEWDVYTIVNPANYDLSNFWFYYKYFEDCLTETDGNWKGKSIKTIIPDDSVRYITQSPGPKLFPIRDFEERKFVFRFYKDSRQEIRSFGEPWLGKDGSNKV